MKPNMEYSISGEIAQYVRLVVPRNEGVWASNGAIVAQDDGITWKLRVPGGAAGAIRRSLSGEGLSLTRIKSSRDGAAVVLAANAPGHILEWSLENNSVLTTRGSFLSAWGPDITIDVSVARRASAAFFGGAGLFLQKVSGTGKVLIYGSGDFKDIELATDESLLVSTGNLAAFSQTVDYQIQTVSGLRNVFFGKEGLFMTRLTGPGRVLLQSLKR
ncbi:MAG: TIGR00266 family protein [Rhodothermales bacterium]|nr:TIGR00266 family protein [Rhodothermales bacterium]